MNYRRNILSASILASLCFASGALAQTAPVVTTPDGPDAQNTGAGATSSQNATEMDTIVVTGIRASLKKSLDEKRAADSHIEVITAEDIGKMPDKNVADSLSRVVGVTISSAGANEGGFDENDRVSMRGTNPSYTQTLINGHSVSSGDWFALNQVGLVGRSVSYTLLPSELVGAVVVHKTSEAADVEGGVAGYVDIQSRKPLDFKQQFTGDVTLGGVYAELPDKTDPQFSGLVNWQNDDKTFGVLLQLFSETRHLRRDGQEELGYNQIAADSPIALAHPDLANVYYPALLGSALFTQKRERTGGMVDAQWAPSSALSFDLSFFDSKLDANNYNRNYLLWGSHFINGGNGQAPDPGYVVRNGTLVKANFTADPATQYGIYDQISRDESSQTQFINLDATWHASDALTFKGQIGDTKGDGKTPTQNVGEYNSGIGSGAFYQLNGTSTASNWNLGNESPSVPGTLSWIFGDQNIDVKDQEKYGSLDAVYMLNNGALTDLKFGGRYADHTRKSEGVIGQGPGPGAFDAANAPSGFQLYPSDFGNEIGSGFPTAVWFYSPGQLAAFNDKFTNRDPVSRSDWNSNYSLEEKDSALYLQADFDGDGWGGNLGVRYVQTKEDIIANVAVNAATPGAITTSAFGPYLPTEFKNTYDDFLPSGNIRFNLSDDMLLRLAASRTMTRADYSALAAPISLSPPAAPGGIGSGSGSNPNLHPVTSNNVDMSWEWYFAPRSLVSASLFYMELTNYIGLGHVTGTFKTFNQIYPEGFDAPYVLTVPVDSKGSVSGFEFAYEQPVWENFGISFNYTYADGHERGGGPLVGTSKNTYNVGAYFENDHWNARLQYIYRSAFYSGLDRSTAFYQDSIGNLSASLGYRLDDHWNFQVQALNLNDPELKYYALNRDQPRSFYDNGRQYYFSVNFKF
jgi:iron complex outermembrane receptor protein